MLQLIFEHELLHAVVSIFTKEINPHGPLFKEMAFDLFGQTKITHGISERVLNTQASQINQGMSNQITQSSQINQQSTTKSDFRLGQIIYFMYRDNKMAGKIIKLNQKRAKVDTARGVFNVYYGSMLTN